MFFRRLTPEKLKVAEKVIKAASDAVATAYFIHEQGKQHDAKKPSQPPRNPPFTRTPSGRRP